MITVGQSDTQDGMIGISDKEEWMEYDEAIRDKSNEPNSQGENAKAHKENGDMWEPEEEFDEGWAVGREQYWSDEEESQTKQTQGKVTGHHKQNQLKNGWRKSKPESYPSKEETNSRSDEINPNKSEDEVITVGQLDTQDGTSGSSDIDTSNKSVKELKGC